MTDIKVISKTQKIIVNSSTSSITVASKTEQPIVISQAVSSVSVINAGPMGPRGVTGPADAENVLTVDGQIMTRAFGGLAPITRTDLAADPAFTASMTAHVAAADPHPVYLTAAEDAIIMAAHVVAADPHPGYMTTAEDAAIMSAHVAAADPHPTYLTAAEGNAAYVDQVGDTMTGTLTINNSGQAIVLQNHAAYIAWFNSSTREGYIQGLNNGLVINSEVGLMTLIGSGGFNLSGGRVDFGGQNLASVNNINGYTLSTGAGANTIACRQADGDIFARYLNCTAGVNGGWPAYIAGGNGDNYIRWYNMQGNLAFTGDVILTSGYGITFADSNHMMRFNSGAIYGYACDGPMIRGYSSVRLCTVAGDYNYLFDSTGTAKANVGWGVFSSQRFKNSIEYMDTIDAVQKVIALKDKTVTYLLNVPEGQPSDEERKLGWLAEEVADIIPELVSLDNEGIPSTINYGGITPLLTSALAETIKRIELLEDHVYKKKGLP